MARQTIKVVLKHDVDNLGHSGELVRVKPGYARNYLIPRGLAALATRANMAAIEHERQAALARAAKAKAEAEGRAAVLQGLEVEISAQAGDNEKLFGSVGAKDIAEALVSKAFEVDRRKIQLAEPIKELGVHPVEIKLGQTISATIQVRVVRAE
ncbi:MAG: 50S ribosomal protein L9 [Sandaracinaceae bacterium]